MIRGRRGVVNVVVAIVAALVAVAVLVALVLLAGADASLGTTDRDVRPVAPSADPRLLGAPQPAGAAPQTLAPPPAGPEPGEPRTCTDADLDVAVSDLADGAPDGPQRVALVWVNGASTPCRLDGFPIVDLVGPGQPRFGSSRYGSILNVPRDETEARPTTLAAGESARSVLQWTPPGARGATGQVWTPDRLVVATPGEGRNQSLPWRYGPLLVANGGRDEPGVSFGPITGG